MSVPARPARREREAPPAQWSPHVGAVADLIAGSALPMLLIWSASREYLLNDACLLLGVGEDGYDRSGSARAMLARVAGNAIETCFEGAAPTCYDVQLQAPGEHASQLWCNLYFTPVHEQDHVVAALCVLVDTSAQVLAQRRIAQAEADARQRSVALSLVYANMEEVAFHIACGRDGSLRFVSVNSAFGAATGLRNEEVIGRQVRDILPESSWHRFRQHYRDVLEKGTLVRWEQTVDFPGGRKIGSVSVAPVFDAERRCTALVVTVHDITDLKRVEADLRDANRELEKLAAELRASEERMGLALEIGGEGVWDWDIERSRMFYSRRWKEMLGLGIEAPDQVELWWNRMHPDDVERVKAQLQDCLSGSKPVSRTIHRLWHESGRWIWVQASGSVVARAPDGTPQRVIGTVEDITSNTELRQAVERSHDLLAKLAQQVPGALFQLVMRPDGRLRCPFISSMATELFHCTPAQIEANFRCLLSRVQKRDRSLLRSALRASASRLQPLRAEFRVVMPDGSTSWREATAKPTRMADGSVVWHGFISDITERKRHEETIRQINERLERRANYDPVTGLPNRVLFRDRLEQEMERAQNGHHSLALLFIDLDRFKEVNDLLGHDAGDTMLALAAKRIGGCLRPGDTLARLGGDEFTVILTQAGEVGHVERIAQEILEVLRLPFRVGIEQVVVSASIGITFYPGDGNTPEDLMRNADHAMYRAKASGRNRIAFYEPAMQVAALRRLRLTHELRRALQEHQFELYFQPIIDIRTGAIGKAEALLRWHRPGNELALPNEFVGIAEETGLIHDIGNWVFFQAANWTRRWSAMLGRGFQVSINKSPVQFQHHGKKVDWVDYLNKQAMPHNSIAVEITEGLLLNLSDSVFAKLHELQAGGIEVSIDDFGTGYSSMTYLKRLHIDYLKIDKSFVAEMLHDRTSQTITETIIVMAHKLGLKVIAEGVELRAQRDWLEEQGCDYLQGFLFGEPVDANRFERLLMGQQPAPAGAANNR